MAGQIRLSRIQPVMPAAAYKSYSLRRPLDTHWRPATCAEAGCDHYRLGWDTVVDTTTELGKRQYDYLHADKTRSFTETREGLTLVRFRYGPGNKPFAGPRHEHRIRLDRPPLLLVTGGDFRGNPRGTEPVVHRTPEDWADDFATHQDVLVRAQQ